MERAFVAMLLKCGGGCHDVGDAYAFIMAAKERAAQKQTVIEAEVIP